MHKISLFCIYFFSVLFSSFIKSICCSKNKKIHRSSTSFENKFTIELLPHNHKKSINPDFPTITIEAKTEYNAWIHIVRTDCVDETLKIFIDTLDKKTFPGLYPFYTREKVFQDSPLWNYNIERPYFSFWKGHAWAVTVDENKKITECKGGVSWGFYFDGKHATPFAFKPKALTKKEWDEDYLFFNNAIDQTK